MANLFFPQLTSGALVQYPIRKTRLVRTIQNIMPSGDMVLFSDTNGGHLVWELEYTDLSPQDTNALQSLFQSCAGPLRGFTFIDPTDNMLAYSADLTGSAWQISSLIHLASGIADPNGGTAGFSITNSGQTNQEIAQTLTVPAGYQYCFSLYARSDQASTLQLMRRGSEAQASSAFAVGPMWNRMVFAGRLNDPGATFSAVVSLAPGQRVYIYGIQLEAQLAPSRYRATTKTSGVYANAHWATEQFNIAAEGPNLFSALLSIETAI